jgi:hypothetical protein
MKPRTLNIDGQQITAEYIGRGLFATAWRHGETVYLLVKEDYSKEAIALFADHSMKHVPTVSRHADIGEFSVYSMPFYRKVTKDETPKAYNQWRVLRKVLPYGASGPTHLGRAIDTLRSMQHDSLADAMQELSDAFANYDHEGMIFETNKANVGADANGDLVLRDCLASRASIDRRFSQRRTRRPQVYSRFF